MHPKALDHPQRLYEAKCFLWRSVGGERLTCGGDFPTAVLVRVRACNCHITPKQVGNAPAEGSCDTVKYVEGDLLTIG